MAVVAGKRMRSLCGGTAAAASSCPGTVMMPGRNCGVAAGRALQSSSRAPPALASLRWSGAARHASGAWRTFATNGSTNGSGDSSYDYDLFTIGAGSGGVRASRFAASYGAKVAVAELPFATKASLTTGGVGGTCVLRGCVPKKLLVYGSEFAKEFDECRGFGWSDFPRPDHDWSKLIANKNAELTRLRGIYKRLLDGSGVDLIEGRGALVDAHTVRVGDKQYTAKHILLATGGLPFVPDIPGKDLVITSDDALDLPTMPKGDSPSMPNRA